MRWQAYVIGRLQLPRPTTEIFRTRADFDRFLEELDVAVDRPRIDFERDAAVLLALGPRSSGGSSVDIVRVEEQRGRVLVVARESYTRTAPALVAYSSLLVVVPETGKPIAVDWR
jgi:hypothetical protein